MSYFPLNMVHNGCIQLNWKLNSHPIVNKLLDYWPNYTIMRNKKTVVDAKDVVEKLSLSELYSANVIFILLPCYFNPLLSKMLLCSLRLFCFFF